MTTETQQTKGPASQRFWILILNIALAILVYWLLGFILDDIGNQPAPAWKKTLAQFQDQTLVKQNEPLLSKETEYSKQVDLLRKKQDLLQTSISSYRDTMNQLLDLQKASTQKGAAISATAQQNLDNATKLYLQGQQQFQTLNNSIAEANDEWQQTRKKSDAIADTLNEQAKKGYETYDKQLLHHNLKIAALKLLVLIPLLLITAYFFIKKRHSIYARMIAAVGFAIIAKIVVVMHEHFPARIFKYLLILVLIFLVVRALITLLRRINSPKIDWLLKQYKAAYKNLFCPICEYPIHPDALKYSAVLQSNVNNITFADSNRLHNIEKYSCPSCGTGLYRKCEVCEHTRHTLLPFCENCGTEKKESQE